MPSRAWWRTAPGTPAPNTELVAVVAVIAAYAIASSVIGEPWQTGLAVAVSVVGLLLARRAGIGAEELGRFGGLDLVPDQVEAFHLYDHPAFKILPVLVHIENHQLGGRPADYPQRRIRRSGDMLLPSPEGAP